MRDSRLSVLKSLAAWRLWAVLVLSFASGLPLALCGSTLQAWFTATGNKLLVVGALSLIGYPYLLKPLWAPLLDRIGFSVIDRRRGWIALTQGVIILGLIAMAFSSPLQTPGFLVACAFIVAIFSATQDSAIDAYRTDILPANERALGATFYSVGYRTALLVATSLAMILTMVWSWRTIYLLMALLMFACLCVTFFAPAPHYAEAPPSTFREAIMQPWKSFSQRDAAWSFLILIVLYKLSDAFALTLTTPFLMRGLGFSLPVIGSVSKFMSVLGSVLGALVGGMWFNRLGLFRSLMIFGVSQVLSNGLFVILAWVGKNYIFMAVALFTENFCAGLSTVAFVTLLTSLCDKRYSATQFALFTALSAVGRVNAGPEAAMLVNVFGWAGFYMSTVLMGIPALWLLQRMKDKINSLN